MLRNICRNRFIGLCFTSLFCSVSTFALRAEDSKNADSSDLKVTVDAPAEWIKPLTFQRLSKNRAVDPAEPWQWLLEERQIHAEKQESFSHFAYQILTSAGVRHGSDISIDFDPSFQTVTIHWIKIWRNTNSFDRLDRKKLKIIQPEDERGDYIYNGKQSAVLLLPDVRVGDIVEYAYTVKGDNPVFDGKFFESLLMQGAVPMERVFARVVWTFPKRRFYVKNQGTTVKPRATRNGDVVEFIWDERNVPALLEEKSMPSWYSTKKWIQLSEFQNWAELNQWALGLFQNKEPFCAELKQTIEKWRRIPNLEERAQMALQFVQDEIRYLGIEAGANGHQPHGINSVFTQRFGDCKDKTWLLVNILRALNIESYPVLVNTEFRHRIESWQPSPGIFDHAIAQIRIGGKIYWVDATANYQRGPLSARYSPDYGYGLVIRPGTAALSPIKSTTGLPMESVTEKFNVRGKNDAAGLEVVTVAEGLEADKLRRQFATVSREEIEKNFLEYYTSIWQEARRVRPLEFQDDEQDNRIEMREFYELNNFWVQSEEDRKYRCSFMPRQISSFLEEPFTRGRSAPLSLIFPRHEIVRMEISLPASWPSDNDRKIIDGPFFFYRRNVNRYGRKWIFEYEYHSLTEAVFPKDFGYYVNQLKEASKAIGETFIWR